MLFIAYHSARNALSDQETFVLLMHPRLPPLIQTGLGEVAKA